MLEVSEAEAASLAGQSASAGPDAVTRVMEVLSDCEMRLRDAASKKILIEVALLKAIEARQAMNLDAVLKQLQGLRNGDPSVGGPDRAEAPGQTTAARSDSNPAAARTSTVASVTPAAPKAAPAASGSGAVDLTAVWSGLVDAVGRASPFARSYLLEAHPVSFKGGVFVIGFDPEFEDHISLVDNARNHTLLQTKLAEMGHAGAQIKFVKAERPADWAAPTASPATAGAPPAVSAKPAPATVAPAKPGSFDKDDFKKDPLIQRALEIFKGQIVEVRT
jgi:hypothetical protein